MSRRPILTVAADFSEVVDHLKDRGILPTSPSLAITGVARNIHSRSYSLILWRFRLRGIPAHGSVFLEEVASDALQVLPQVLMGYSKTAKMLMRGIVENTLRHLYFLDHPIEFQRMNREAKWFLTMEALFDYGKNHPIFQQVESKFDALNQMSSIYSELSAGIHGRTVRDLEMRKALQSISYDQATAERESELMRRCTEAVSFIIAMLHHDRVARFRIEDRRVILNSLPTRARQVWREFEPI
jgi:hypothetical protein